MIQRRFMAGFLFGLVLLHAEDTFQVSGAVKQPLTLTAGDLAKMPRTSTRMTIHGVETLYEGVRIAEILKKAGAPQGEALRGKALAGYILAQAQDGYQVVFSLGEMDPSFVENDAMLADTANGKPLGKDQGPFRLIIPKEKVPARSVRMITGMQVVQLAK